MMKNSKNFKFKSFISGIIISIIIGVFCYFILNFVSSANSNIKNDNQDLNFIYKLKHKFWEGIAIPIFDEEKFVKDDSISKRSPKEKKLLGSIPVRMYSLLGDEDYVMNDSQFQTFVDKLEEKLPYGPEIYGLNVININKDKGNFFNPLYKFINLEVEPFYESIDNLSGITYNELQNKKYISFYDKHISTAVHEYLHYVDEIYSISYFAEDTKKLYELGGDSIVKSDDTIPVPKEFYVNKKFIENFKKILNYDNEKLLTTSQSSAVSKNKNNLETFTPKKTKELLLTSVANKYPVKWMWDRVNESPKVDLKIPKGQENIVIGSKDYFDFILYNKKFHSIWSKWQYYFYKYSELFARRFSSLLYKEDKEKLKKNPFFPFLNLEEWKGFVEKNGIKRFDFTTTKNDFRFSRITPTIYNPNKNDPYNNSLKIQDVWFDDYPYDSEEIPSSNSQNYNTYRSTRLYNLLRKLMGQYDGSDISWIIRNNRFKYRNLDIFKNREAILAYINGKWNLVKEKKSNNKNLIIPEWVRNNLNDFRFEVNAKNDDFLLRMGGYLSEKDINDLNLPLLSFNQKVGLEAKIGILNEDSTITSLNKKVKIHKYNVRKVSSFIENQYIEFNQNGDNYFWIVNNLDEQNVIEDSNNKYLEDFDYDNDFIDLKKIENKKLVLFNKDDLTKYIPLKSARYESEDEDDEFGKTSTIINKTILQNDKEYAYANEEGGFAKIQKSEILST